MTAPNAELAYKVLDLAMAHRTSLDMSQWSSGLVDLTNLTDQDCGTTACYAGWVAAHAGYKVHISGAVYHADGSIASGGVEVFAAQLLGMDANAADYLFYVSDDDLEGAVTEIFGPRPDYGTGCRCDWLGKGTPEHAPTSLCRPAVTS